tara:strand:+ start:230 stop:469 length:240 start_codon:yes stop_codon:yes gene_type:complete
VSQRRFVRDPTAVVRAVPARDAGARGGAAAARDGGPLRRRALRRARHAHRVSPARGAGATRCMQGKMLFCIGLAGCDDV